MNATVTDTEDAFMLDVRIIEDVRSRDDRVACNTDNGCDPTCASACASGA